jgi:hypothetical protein
MHCPPQLISGPGHDTAHTPPPQTCPLVHAVPALPPATPQPGVAPQWTGLDIGSMQVPLQLT